MPNKTMEPDGGVTSLHESERAIGENPGEVWHRMVKPTRRGEGHEGLAMLPFLDANAGKLLEKCFTSLPGLQFWYVFLLPWMKGFKGFLVPALNMMAVSPGR